MRKEEDINLSSKCAGNKKEFGQTSGVRSQLLMTKQSAKKRALVTKMSALQAGRAGGAPMQFSDAQGVHQGSS